MRKRLFFICILLIFFSTFIVCAEKLDIKNSKVKSSVENVLSSNAEVRVFVKFKEDNSFVNGQKSNIYGKNNSYMNISVSKKLREFNSLNGFSAVVNNNELNDIANSDRVESIDVVGEKRLMLQSSVPLINATLVHNLQLGGVNLTGAGQTICIIDTGVNYSHPDLGGCYGNNDVFSGCKVIGGWDYCADDNLCFSEDSNPMDVEGHGTHVSGIASASGNIVGVAPGAKLVVVKAYSSVHDVFYDDVLRGSLDWCINNASKFNISVISMSLGGGLYSGYCDNQDDPFGITTAINNAVAKDISVIVAAGNDGSYTDISSPACIQNAIPVGSIRRNDATIDYNRNSLVQLLAPGYSINSTVIDGGYESWYGTSMATPHVAGAVAILNQYLMSKGLNKTPQQIESLLNSTGKRVSDSGYSNLFFSRVDVYDAIMNFSSDCAYPNYTDVAISGDFRRYTNFSYNITLEDNSELSRAWFESNFSGSMQNYSYALSGLQQNLSLSFNITGIVRSFSYRLGVNDSSGNVNYTEWSVVNVVNTPPVNLAIGNKSWVMNSNKTINLSQYFSDVDEDGLVFSNSSVANISIVINQTSGIVTIIPDFGFNGTRYVNFSANDSTNITLGNNISLTVFRPIIVFNQTNFSSSTTNFSNLTNFVNISVFIEKTNVGAINFSSVSIENESEDLDSHINLSYNFISLNSSMLSGFNRSANLSLYNISFSNPIIYRDGVVCSSDFCNQISYVNGTFVFGVYGFSEYTTLDAFCGDSVCSSGEDCSSCSSDCGGCASSSPAGGGGSGGGGGGGATVSFADSSILDAGYLRKMSGGDRVIMDFGGVNHSLYLNKVINNSVNITIKSDPIVLMLNYGEEIRLNLTSADYYDLYIRVGNISGAKASIFVKKINESIKSSVSERGSRGVSNQNNDASSDLDVEVVGPVSGYIYVIASIVAVFCLMIMFAILRMMHSKREMRKKGRR